MMLPLEGVLLVCLQLSSLTLGQTTSDPSSSRSSYVQTNEVQDASEHINSEQLVDQLPGAAVIIPIDLCDEGLGDGQSAEPTNYNDMEENYVKDSDGNDTILGTKFPLLWRRKHHSLLPLRLSILKHAPKPLRKLLLRQYLSHRSHAPVLRSTYHAPEQEQDQTGEDILQQVLGPRGKAIDSDIPENAYIVKTTIYNITRLRDNDQKDNLNVQKTVNTSAQFSYLDSKDSHTNYSDSHSSKLQTVVGLPLNQKVEDYELFKIFLANRSGDKNKFEGRLSNLNDREGFSRYEENYPKNHESDRGRPDDFVGGQYVIDYKNDVPRPLGKDSQSKVDDFVGGLFLRPYEFGGGPGVTHFGHKTYDTDFVGGQFVKGSKSDNLPRKTDTDNQNAPSEFVGGQFVKHPDEMNEYLLKNSNNQGKQTESDETFADDLSTGGILDGDFSTLSVPETSTSYLTSISQVASKETSSTTSHPEEQLENQIENRNISVAQHQNGTGHIFINTCGPDKIQWPPESEIQGYSSDPKISTDKMEDVNLQEIETSTNMNYVEDNLTHKYEDLTEGPYVISALGISKSDHGAQSNKYIQQPVTDQTRASTRNQRKDHGKEVLGSNPDLNKAEKGVSSESKTENALVNTEAEMTESPLVVESKHLRSDSVEDSSDSDPRLTTNQNWYLEDTISSVSDNLQMETKLTDGKETTQPTSEYDEYIDNDVDFLGRSKMSIIDSETTTEGYTVDIRGNEINSRGTEPSSIKDLIEENHELPGSSKGNPDNMDGEPTELKPSLLKFILNDSLVTAPGEENSRSKDYYEILHEPEHPSNNKSIRPVELFAGNNYEDDPHDEGSIELVEAPSAECDKTVIDKIKIFADLKMGNSTELCIVPKTSKRLILFQLLSRNLYLMKGGERIYFGFKDKRNLLKRCHSGSESCQLDLDIKTSPTENPSAANDQLITHKPFDKRHIRKGNRQNSDYRCEEPTIDSQTDQAVTEAIKNQPLERSSWINSIEELTKQKNETSRSFTTKIEPTLIPKTILSPKERQGKTNIRHLLNYDKVTAPDESPDQNGPDNSDDAASFYDKFHNIRKPISKFQTSTKTRPARMVKDTLEDGACNCGNSGILQSPSPIPGYKHFVNKRLDILTNMVHTVKDWVAEEHT